MHTESWIRKAKKTYSEYVIRIAFSLQQTVSAADATFQSQKTPREILSENNLMEQSYC
jgi:hypothetical protein